MINNLIILLLFNTLAIVVYFLKICLTYGCFYKNKLFLPLEGITLPVITLLKDFKMGLNMMLSYNNAWIYIFIASGLSLCAIYINNRRNEKKN